MENNSKKIFITGPWAAGKSTTAEKLSKMLNFEVYCPDKIFRVTKGNMNEYFKKNGLVSLAQEVSKILRKIPDKNLIVPYNLFGFDEISHIKRDDAKFCRNQGIIILILPSESIEECARICYERELSRDYDVSLEQNLIKMRSSIPILKQISDFIIIDNISPESAANKIYSQISSIFSK